MEIFNFFRKFGSNLKNGSSGSSVIISKKSTPPHCLPPAPRGGHRRSNFAAFPRAGTSPSPWHLRRALSQPGELIPAINSLIATVVPPISPSALLRRQLAPPLAVASVEQHPSCPATPMRSPRPCASLRLAYATWVGRSRPAQLLLPRARPELRHRQARRGQDVPECLRLHRAHQRVRGESLIVFHPSL